MTYVPKIPRVISIARIISIAWSSEDTKLKNEMFPPLSTTEQPYVGRAGGPTTAIKADNKSREMT